MDRAAWLLSLRRANELQGKGSDGARAKRPAQIPGMGESAVSDNEADEMEEHLRGLHRVADSRSESKGNAFWVFCL